MVDDYLEEMVKQLQRKIDYDEEKTYSKIVIEEYRNPTNFGVIEHPDALGEVTGSCNDTMKFTLSIEQGIIRNARFWTDGCGASLACGNMLISMIIGKRITEANRISYRQLLSALDGLPKEHRHCARLAIDTLHAATDDYNSETKKTV